MLVTKSMFIEKRSSVKFGCARVISFKNARKTIVMILFLLLALSTTIKGDSCVVSLVAGTLGSPAYGTPGLNGDGGRATSAQMGGPLGTWKSTAETLLIAEKSNKMVRQVGLTDNVLSPFAGGVGSDGDGNGQPATAASVGFVPNYICGGADNVVYIVNNVYSQVRRVGSDGIISNFAGVRSAHSAPPDSGVATSVALNYPKVCAVDGNLDVYIPHYDNNKIGKVEIGCGES